MFNLYILITSAFISNAYKLTCFSILSLNFAFQLHIYLSLAHWAVVLFSISLLISNCVLLKIQLISYHHTEQTIAKSSDLLESKSDTNSGLCSSTELGSPYFSEVSVPPLSALHSNHTNFFFFFECADKFQY